MGLAGGVCRSDLFADVLGSRGAGRGGCRGRRVAAPGTLPANPSRTRGPRVRRAGHPGLAFTPEDGEDIPALPFRLHKQPLLARRQTWCRRRQRGGRRALGGGPHHFPRPRFPAASGPRPQHGSPHRPPATPVPVAPASPAPRPPVLQGTSIALLTLDTARRGVTCARLSLAASKGSARGR